MPADLQDSPDQPSTSRGRAGAALFGGAALTALSRAFAQLSQILVFIYAARTLGPADFGLFALVSAVAIVCLRVSEAGWNEYIMSWSGDRAGVQKVLGIAWASGLAMAVFGLLVAAAGLPFFDHSDIPLLVAGFAIWIFLATPSAAWNGIMIWQGRIMAFAFTGMTGEAIGLAVTLLMLSKGYGLLALVGGRLAQQIVFVIVAALTTRVLPRLDAMRERLPNLASFSLSILASRLILILRSYSSVFIVGGFFGPETVGFYRAGQRVVGASLELIGEPVRILAWKTFRNVRDVGTLEAKQNFANVFFPLTWVIAIPAFLWISYYAEAIITGLLGPEWAPAAVIISIIAFAALISISGYATEPLLSLTGHATLMPPLFLSYAILAVVLTLISGPFGVIAVASVQVLATAIMLVVELEVYRRKVGFALRPILHNLLPAVIPLVAAFSLLWFVDHAYILSDMNVLVRALLLSLPSIAVYFLLLAVFYRNTLRTFRRMMK